MNVPMNSLMPLLSRIVIAMAMVTTGWVNCFAFVEVTTEQATTLEAMSLQVITDAETGDQTTRGLHRISLLLQDEWPELGGWGKLLAWSGAIFELLAGVLLFVGLFSRLSAFVVCLIMGMALYLVSFKLNGMFCMNPFDWPLDQVAFSRLFTEMCLFLLALGIFIGGGGFISIDRFQEGKRAESSVSKEKRTKKGDD